MAMTIPSPSSSDDSSIPPATPTIPSDLPSAAAGATATNGAPSAAANAGAANAAMKRKPSRRANTAERRATHNAVERQRRETLNGRFLDLASLLPNLSQIRRPSKSSIVNSSIAHIHASRRHRMMASRELRALKMESDALRRELNEWRDRAGIPRVEEPVRSDAFSIVLSGELEVLTVSGVGGEDEDDELVGPVGTPQQYSGMQYEDDMYEVEDPRMVMLHQAPPPPPMQHRPSISIHPNAAAASGPIIASPTAMSFENPAIGIYSNEHIQPPYPTPTTNGYPDKVAQWNLYQQQQQQQQIILQQQAHHRNSISHGHPQSLPHAHNHGPHPADQAYLASLRQGRERSSSIASYHSTGTTAGTGSPPHAPSLTLSSASGGGSSASSSGSASPASHQYDVYDGQAGWMMPGPKQGSPTGVVGGPGNAVVAYAMMM